MKRQVALLLRAGVLAGCKGAQQPPAPAPASSPGLNRGANAEILELGTLGGNASLAFAIDDRGQVVGYSTLASGERRPFPWSRQSGMRDLETLGGHFSAAWASTTEVPWWG